MKVVSGITDPAIIDRILRYLKKPAFQSGRGRGRLGVGCARSRAIAPAACGSGHQRLVEQSSALVPNGVKAWAQGVSDRSRGPGWSSERTRASVTSVA